MSALEIIEQIKELSASEQAQIARFITESDGFMAHHKFSIGIESDGLPVIRAQDGTITAQLVHEIEAGHRDPPPPVNS
jgi:hypothetical protein